MMFRRRARVVVGATKTIGVEARALEEARRAEVDRAVAERVSRKRFAFNDDPVVEDHRFAAQIDHRKLVSDTFGVGRQFIEPGVNANFFEVAVLLGRFGDDDLTALPRREKRVVRHRAQYSAVGHDAFQGRVLVPAFERVPVPNKVWFQDDL